MTCSLALNESAENIFRALVLRMRGDLDGALVLHREEERHCRDAQDPGELSRSLGNQALVLKARGNLDEAMGFLKDAGAHLPGPG